MENKKYLKTMNENELKKVFNENFNLKNDVIERIQDAESDYVGDILEKLNPFDYSISLYSYSYIKFSDMFDFFENVKNANDDFGIIGTDAPQQLAEIEEKICILYDTEMYSDEYNKLFDEIENDMMKLAEYITNYLVSFYDINDETAIDYFITEASYTYENYYIKDNNYDKIFIMVEKYL